MVRSKTSFSSLLITGACALFSLATTTGAYASDTERIARLEKEIQELKERLANLEVSRAKSNGDQKSVESGAGWKHLANWRSLKKEMTYDDVRRILGEPMRVHGGDFTFWYYANKGRVSFYQDRLSMWQEPQ